MWYIHWTPRLFEAVVDVEKKIVLSHTEMSRDFHGPGDRTELSGAAAAALEDAQVKKEIARLQLKETSIVLDPWDYGADGEETQERHTTPYQDGQLFPAGDYTNQSLGGTGISSWESIKTHAPIRNRDIVIWHTFGFTHNPRVEDFPVMPAEIARVHLKPYNFALFNPSNDVPQSIQSMNKSVLFDAGAVVGADASILSCCTTPTTSSSKL
ncbi:hypothetical protein EG327_011329 [Venturia inaequalis]|nr:hypothetical protein EG327_011329 [Venturia inaequalis]